MSERAQPAFAFVGAGAQPATAISEPAAEGWSLSFGLVLLFIAALYCQIALVIPALAQVAPMNIIGGGAILAVAIERLRNRTGVELVWPESYLLIAFVGVAALSCLGALWPRLAAEDTLELAKYAAVYFLILHTITDERRLRVLLWTMVLGGLFPAAGTLRNFFEGTLSQGRSAWIGIFGNPNELAYGLTILVPIAAYLAVTGRGRSKMLVWAVLAVYTAAICVTFSRGGLMGFVAVAALLGWKWRSAPVLLLSVILIGATGTFLAYGWTRGEGFTGLQSDLDFQQRIATTEAGLAMFADHPLTGVGVGCSVVAWPLYAPPSLYTRGWLITHNTFAEALSETGILGFITFMSLLGAAFLRARRMGRDAHSLDFATTRLGSALEVSLWGFAICSLSGGWMLTWFPYILFGLISAAQKIASQKAGYSSNDL